MTITAVFVTFFRCRWHHWLLRVIWEFFTTAPHVYSIGCSDGRRDEIRMSWCGCWLPLLLRRWDSEIALPIHCNRSARRQGEIWRPSGPQGIGCSAVSRINAFARNVAAASAVMETVLRWVRRLRIGIDINDSARGDRVTPCFPFCIISTAWNQLSLCCILQQNDWRYSDEWCIYLELYSISNKQMPDKTTEWKIEIYPVALSHIVITMDASICIMLQLEISCVSVITVKAVYHDIIYKYVRHFIKKMFWIGLL